MSIKLMRFLVIFGSGVMALTAVASSFQHRVQLGETLSDILYKYNLKPLYGKNGFVKKTIRLNKGKIKKNGSFVLVGTNITIPGVGKKRVAEIREQAPAEPNVSVMPIVPEVLAPSIAPNIERYPSEEHTYSFFKLSPFYSFLKLDSTNTQNLGGSNVILLSNKGLGLNGSWNLALDEQKTFFGYGSLEYFTFQADPNYVFNHKSLTRFHFGVGENFQYSPELSISAVASLREISFLDVITPTTVNVASLTVPEFSLGLKKTLLTKKNVETHAGGHISGIFPGSSGSYRSKSGYGAGVLAEMKHKEKSLELTYDYRSLKINNINNNESQIKLMMNFSFDKDY